MSDTVRICAEPDCGTQLSRYNKAKKCSLHEGRIYPRNRGKNPTVDLKGQPIAQSTGPKDREEQRRVHAVPMVPVTVKNEGTSHSEDPSPHTNEPSSPSKSRTPRRMRKPTIKPKRIKCPDCGQLVASNRALDVHRESYHREVAESNPRDEELIQEIRQLAAQITEEPASSHSYQAAVMLLASLVVGPRIKAIKSFTGLPWASVQAISWNLRRDKVWDGDAMDYRWLDDDNEIAFICDALTGSGEVRRSEAPSGEVLYRHAELAYEKCWMEPTTDEFDPDLAAAIAAIQKKTNSERSAA